MHTFDTDGPTTVVVRTGTGRVTITSEDTPVTTVEVTALNSAGQEAVAGTTLDQTGGSVVIDVPRRNGSMFRQSPQVGVTITCPRGSSLQVRAQAADVRATGSYATAELTTGSGDLVVEHVTDTARLKAGSGSVSARAVEGTLMITTGSGDVSVDQSGTTSTLTVGSGDISIGELRGEVVTKTGSGDIEVGVLAGSLQSKTGSGDLIVRRAAAGMVRATGASGSISIGIPEGTAAWLDLSTITGRVTQELGESEAPQGDQQRVQVTAHTVSGDLRVHRS